MAADDIDATAPLFIEGLGLDSIDALELGLALQKRYGITHERRQGGNPRALCQCFGAGGVRGVAAPAGPGLNPRGHRNTATTGQIMTHDEIFARWRRFSRKPSRSPRSASTPEARLYDDLDIDSIDAVDLLVKLKPMLNKPLKPEQFKSVRTVQDVVQALALLIDSAGHRLTPDDLAQVEAGAADARRTRW